MHITCIECTDRQAGKGLISTNKGVKTNNGQNSLPAKTIIFDMKTDNEFVVAGCASELVLVLTCYFGIYSVSTTPPTADYKAD